LLKITVDGGMMLKRLRPAPQGRAHRIRKRSNHVTIVLDLLITQSNLIKMGQKTNPIGNRLGIIRDGTQTGMVEMIMVINLPKITKSESISMLVYQKLVYQK
jgi:large subunit ribosomal protein L22